MRKLVLTLSIICSALSLLHAQNLELSVGANTGWFAYSGPGATANTSMFVGTSSANSDVLNAYGTKYASSYGVSIQSQYVYKGGFILGLQGSYDILRSKASIPLVYPFEYYYTPYYSTPPAEPARGNDILQTQVINLNPYFGYRLKAGNVKIDIMPGMSFGFDIASREKGKAMWGDTSSMQTENKQPTQHVDVQLKLGVAASLGRWGLVASYAYGLNDLEPVREIVPVTSGASQYPIGYYGPDDKIHSRLFRLGLSYRLFSSRIK